MHPHIKPSGETLQIAGEISVATVVELRDLGYKLITNHIAPIFDLQKIVIKDNAIVPLLLAWLRYAKKANKDIKFINIPKNVIAMLELSGLSDFMLH